MNTNVVAFAGQNLPAVTTLATALRTMEADIGPSGVVILKMDKTGHWVFGADQTEVEDDSTWAVNPFSFTHGYIAWGEGEVLAEKMAPITSPLPEVDAPPAAAKKGWEMQVGFSIMCMSGEDKDMEARYAATSLGGKKAVQALAASIANQCDKDSSNPVAVVSLKKEHYMHKQYGRIYTPVFAIKEWIALEGKQAEAAPPATTGEAAPAPEVAPAAEEGTGRRRRRAAE